MFDRLLHEGKVAGIFLTRIPITSERPIEDHDLARSTPFFPLVGAGLGAVAGAVFAGAAGLGLPPLIGACLAVLTLVLLTGALHEDGLADVADGFGGSHEASRRLEIMRDPRTGSFGALALVFSVLLRVGALASLSEPLVVMTAATAAGAVSRASLPALMHVLPPARGDGLAAGAGRPSLSRTILCALIAGAIAAAVLGGAGAMIALLATSAGSIALGALAFRKIGGLTGDVLGAAQQVGEVLVLLSLVAFAM